MMEVDHGSPTRFQASDVVYPVNRLKSLKSHKRGPLRDDGVTPYESIRIGEKLKTHFLKSRDDENSQEQTKPKENL